MKKRVVVAISGGVDSSIAAYLLLKQGFEVIGVNLRLFNPGPNDAKTIASALGIRLHVLDCEKEFEGKVVNYFSKEYRNGRTPNPCIICNKKIKFASLLKKARGLGAEYIATGHYAKIKYNKANKRYVLKKGKDKSKDQSYFLFLLSQEVLKRTLFPLGDYTKNQVRRLARRIGLKAHNKRGSQEICFIPDNNYKNFLLNRFPDFVRPGPIANTKGEILGRHQGISFYTIGQRKGLRIPYKNALYVLAIDKKNNTIVVGEEDETYSGRLIATNVNWITNGRIDASLRVKAMIRYKHRPAEAIVSRLNKNRAKVEFIKPQRSITPGQAVVFYRRDTVVGGGIIEKATQ